MTTFCVAVMNCLTSHPFSFLFLPGVPISIRWAHACPLTVSISALRHRKLASLWKLLEQVQTILFSYPPMIGIKDPLPGPCSCLLHRSLVFSLSTWVRHRSSAGLGDSILISALGPPNFGWCLLAVGITGSAFSCLPLRAAARWVQQLAQFDPSMLGVEPYAC